MKYFLGIDLGGTNLVVGLVDEEYKLLDKDSIPTRAGGNSEELITDMCSLADQILLRNKLKLSDIESVGVGVPGTANWDTGRIEFANNLAFNDEPFLQVITAAFEGTKVFFDNDANAAAWGEYLGGSARGSDSMVMITLGTGVGGGIILNGKIFEGINYAAGELGHMVIKADGKYCNCGRRGCFEVYASATALVEQTREAMSENKASVLWELCQGELNKVEGKTLFQGISQGDKTAEKVLENFIIYLGAGVINIINIFQPDIICIGGGISNAGDAIVGPLKEIIKKESYSRTSKKQPEIVIATLNNDAGLIGAAMLHLNNDN